MRKFLDLINIKCFWLDSKIRLLPASIIIGYILLVAASLYVEPRFEAAYHGETFSRMSQAPFDLDQQYSLQYRVLTPLIGYVLRVSKKEFVGVPIAFGVLLLSAIYAWYRRKEYTPSEALGLASLIAFSTTIFIPLISPGYTDTTTYFLILLCFIFIGNLSLFALSFSLALFNHESVLFLWPAMFAFAFQENGKSKYVALKFLGATILAMIPYLLFRRYIGEHVTVEYDTGFYLTADNIKHNVALVWKLVPLGWFFAFKLFWSLPIAFVFLKIRERNFAATIPVLLIVIGTSLQLLIAFDITRLFALAFIAILLSAEGLKHYVRPDEFARGLWFLVIANLLVLQYFIAAEGAFPLFSPIVNAMVRLFGSMG